MIVVLRSLGITFAVSAAVALFLTEFDFTFWKPFLFVTVIQFVGWFAYNKRLEAILIKDSHQVTERMVTEIAKQQTPLPCNFCKHINIVDIRIDEDNGFECTSCGKNNAVYVSIDTAATTDIIDTTKGVRNE